MDSADEVRAHLNARHESVWELAAVVLALRDAAGVAERIELRHQDVATLTDREVFCLGWLPAPFIPPAAIDAGLARMVDALVPGGWLMVGHGKFSGQGLSDALTRFQTVAFGRTALNGDEARQMLAGVGLEQVGTIPTPEGAPGITVGRRALRS